MSKEDQQRELATNRLLEILRAERNSEDVVEQEDAMSNSEDVVENEEENKIIEVVKSGYMFNEKVLRPTIVKVGGEK